MRLAYSLCFHGISCIYINNDIGQVLTATKFPMHTLILLVKGGHNVWLNLHPLT